VPVETWSVSTGTADFVVGVDKKLCVGSALFENCKSVFGTQGAAFGSKRIALPDDAAGCSSTFVGWGWICVTELSCKMFRA